MLWDSKKIFLMKRQRISYVIIKSITASAFSSNRFYVISPKRRLKIDSSKNIFNFWLEFSGFCFSGFVVQVDKRTSVGDLRRCGSIEL